jgi:glycosyltransferase involved in cell wall biosynthesis
MSTTRQMILSNSSHARAPEVTVVIPTRDRPALLRQSVRSALCQEGTTVEVVIIEDGARGGEGQTLEQELGRRVTVCRSSGVSGQAAARNAGIRRARGDWIAFLDDDDLWAPRKLRQQIDAARVAGASFAYGGAVVVSASLLPLQVLPPPQPDRLPREILERNIIPAGASNVVVKTGAVRALGGFDERLSHLCDWDLWIRLALTDPGAACREVVVGYRQHADNLVVTSPKSIRAELRYVRAKHFAARRAAGVQIDNRSFREWRAAGHVRGRRRGSAACAYLSLAGRYRSRTAAKIAIRSAFGAWPEDVSPSQDLVGLDWLHAT